MPNKQPSLEQWEKEFRDLMFQGGFDETYKEVSPDKLWVYFRDLISQAKAQGAEEEKQKWLKICNEMNDEVLKLKSLLTPQKEEA